MNVVLFLGAGFSKPSGYPLMLEFFQHARDSPLLSEQEKEFLKDLVLHARQGASMIRGDDKHLEHVLSFAQMSHRLGTAAQNQGLSPSDRLARIIRKIYGRPVGSPEMGNVQTYFRDLIGFSDARAYKHRLSVITTNYDLLIDWLLYLLGMPAFLGMPTAPLSEDRRNYLYGANPQYNVPLYKLHGSVNFVQDTKRPEVVVVDDAVVSTISMGVEPHHSVSPACWLARPPERAYTPLIIPPTLVKGNIDPRFASVWEGARRALADADRIAFVGYSFPESDVYMRYFIGGALVDNTRADHLDILDPCAPTVIARIRGSRPEFGPSFLDRLRPIEKSWISRHCIASE